MWKKNLLTILISTILSIFLLYSLFFLKIHFEHHDKAPYLFKSIDKLKFHKNYSKKLHHLRDSDGRWEIKDKPNNYLFSVNHYRTRWAMLRLKISRMNRFASKSCDRVLKIGGSSACMYLFCVSYHGF